MSKNNANDVALKCAFPNLRVFEGVKIYSCHPSDYTPYLEDQESNNGRCPLVTVDAMVFVKGNEGEIRFCYGTFEKTAPDAIHGHDRCRYRGKCMCGGHFERGHFLKPGQTVAEAADAGLLDAMAKELQEEMNLGPDDFLPEFPLRPVAVIDLPLDPRNRGVDVVFAGVAKKMPSKSAELSEVNTMNVAKLQEEVRHAILLPETNFWVMGHEVKIVAGLNTDYVRSIIETA